MSSKIEALMRGLGQGASLGLNDDFSPGLVSAADKVTGWLGLGDQTGIPREYAAGSAYDDMRNTERRENAESERAYPTTYRAAHVAGGIPSSIAMSGLAGGATLPTLSRLVSSAPRIAW